MLPELEAAQNMLKYLHHHAKQELEGLDEEGLNWTPPGVDAVNSIYGLALHIASSQVSFAAALIGERLKLEIPDLEKGGNLFQLHGNSAEQARTLLRQAAEITNQAFEKVTPEHLAAAAALPGGGKGNGHSWVQLMVMHAGEHVGHMSLTRQLYQSHVQAG
jgi:hypothetical protein